MSKSRRPISQTPESILKQEFDALSEDDKQRLAELNFTPEQLMAHDHLGSGPAKVTARRGARAHVDAKKMGPMAGENTAEMEELRRMYAEEAEMAASAAASAGSAGGGGGRLLLIIALGAATGVIALFGYRQLAGKLYAR